MLVLTFGLRKSVGVLDSGPGTGALAARNIAILSATELLAALPSALSAAGAETGGEKGGGAKISDGPTLLRRSAAILSLTVGAALAVVSVVVAQS